MGDVERGCNVLETFREKLNAVAERVLEDALNAPTARERFQAARLVFDVLGLLSGGRAPQVSVQARGSTHALTDKLMLEGLDVRVTGIDPAGTGDVQELVRNLGFVSHRQNDRALHDYLCGGDADEG